MNISAVLKQIKSSNHIIDLNIVSPIPLELKGFTVDSISYRQYYLTKYLAGKKESLLEHFIDSGKPDFEKFIGDIITKRPHNDCGDIMYENEQVLGFPTWREFVKKHWGLGNNNSYGSSMFNVNTISLATFNQYPKPIIKKLSQMFPNDLMEIKYASELPGEYAKSFKILNGHVVSNEKVSDKRLIYCEVFQKNPNTFTDINRKETIKNIINHVEEVA